MQTRLAWITVTSLVGALALALAPRSAAAQYYDDEVASDGSESEASPWDPSVTRVGAGFRVRNVRVPRGLIELFVERAEGGSSEWGVGLEVIRRKGTFEVQFGLEWDNIFIKPGYWIDKGEMIPQHEADLVTFSDEGYLSWGTFGWLTAEVTFLNHSPIIDQLAIRYGGGAGIGIVKGEVTKRDATCSGTTTDTCRPYGTTSAYDIPPVMLVVNAIIGVQITPIDNMFINVEGGLRTFPFFGMTAGYFF
jgi:hypothetical protein